MGIEQATQDFLTIFPNLILINEHRARRCTQIDYQCVSVFHECSIIKIGFLP